jgi:hypothetical protein
MIHFVTHIPKPMSYTCRNSVAQLRYRPLCNPVSSKFANFDQHSRILHAPRDSAHSNKSDPRRPDPCDPAKHADTLSLGGIKARGRKRMSALHGTTQLVGVRDGQSRKRRGMKARNLSGICAIVRATHRTHRWNLGSGKTKQMRAIASPKPHQMQRA